MREPLGPSARSAYRIAATLVALSLASFAALAFWIVRAFADVALRPDATPAVVVGGIVPFLVLVAGVALIACFPVGVGLALVTWIRSRRRR